VELAEASEDLEALGPPAVSMPRTGGVSITPVMAVPVLALLLFMGALFLHRSRR
jgi:hypothetical protein